MPQSITTPAITVESLTELREAADNLLRYVSFATQEEISQAQITALGLASPQSSFDSALCQKMLGNSENIPTYSALQTELEAIQEEPGQGASLSIENYAIPESVLKRTKEISVVYHRADAKVDFSATQTDVSALFCGLVPPVEMSLCVPYFDVKIVYPTGGSGVGALSPFRFVGLSSEKQKRFDSSNSLETNSLIGFDVAGMEIFCMPQTLAGDKTQLNSPELLADRGLEVLDPLVPLMTIESANIQQTGIGGSLYAQTKVDLSIILHDRSRLSDIEQLVSVEVFPALTFQIEYGWAHPDTNKMTGGAFAKLLNAMRSKQQFALYSVSVSTRDTSSLKINLSLVSKGSYVAKSASVVTAGGEYLPYSVIQTLLKQFVNVTTKRNSGSSTGKNAPTTVTYNPGKVGTSIVASTSNGTTSNKFIPVSAFYDLVKKVEETAKGTTPDNEKIDAIIEQLVSIDGKGVTLESSDHLKSALKFIADPSGSLEYGINIEPFVFNSETQFVSNYDIRQKIAAINKDAGLLPASGSQSVNVVPLVTAVAQLVAKPLLLTLPDIDEVRIHCFSFNKSCGVMSGENIGNFPIVISDLLEERSDENKLKKSGLNTRSSAQTALNKILVQVNSPGSRYYGFSAETERLSAAVEAIREQYRQDASKLASEEEDTQKNAKEGAQKQIDTLVKSSNEKIEELNRAILREKNITSDTAFIPARVKMQMDTLGAYSNSNEKGRADKNIIRIVIYDERAGGHNDLGNLIFGMANTNGLASVLGGASETLSAELLNKIKTNNSQIAGEETVYGFKSKQAFRELASKMYPTITVGTDGSCVTSANFSSSPSGEIASSYLLTALDGGSASSVLGDTSSGDLADDVIIIPSTVTLNMLGNVCMSRGQIYYVDFSTGTTVDNSYAVQGVTHTIRPGSFTTTATMIPVNSATVRTASRQINELVTLLEKSQNKTGIP
jgi:hypothetical protein